MPPLDDNDIGPLLERMGYRYVAGWGPTAVWEVPGVGEEGDDNYEAPFKVSQVSLADQALGAQSPYKAQAQTRQDTTPDVRYNERGEALQWNGSDWAPQAALNDPRKAVGYQAPSAPRQPSVSYSYNTSQSLQDPRALELQARSLQAQIEESLRKDAIDQQKLQFERDRAVVEDERGNKQIAIQAQQLAEIIAARVEQSGIARQRMTQELAMFDRQIAESKALEQSRQQFQSGEAATGRGFADTQGQNAFATDIYGTQQSAATADRTDATNRAGLAAEFSRNPGDVGAQAAFYTGIGGATPLSTAIGQGKSAITDQSLVPLAALLAPGPERPAAPTYQRWIEPQRPPVTLDSAIAAGQAPPTAQAQPAPTAFGNSAQGVADFRGANQGNQSADDLTKALGFAEGTGGWIDAPEQFIAGDSPSGQPHGLEEAVEVRDPEGNAEIRITPGMLTQMIMMAQGGMPKDAPKMAHGTKTGAKRAAKGEKVPHYAAGTLNLNDLIGRARQFIDTAGQSAIQRSGFEGVPTPVSLADPGTDPFLQELGAGVAGTARGINPRSFLNEILKARPQGMQQGLQRRSI